MTRFGVIAAGVVVLALPATGTGSLPRSETQTLERYLATMSWPLRASTARAVKISDAIRGAVSPGDPPFLGQVGLYCRRFRAVEETGRILKRGAILGAIPPSALRSTHGALVQTYEDARAGCVRARAVALAVHRAIVALVHNPSIELERARRRGLNELVRFDRTKLEAFKQAVRAWREAVLRYAPTVGVAPPDWLAGLRLGP